MRQPVPFGKYLLLDRISVGGMAEVFKAKSYGVEGFEKIIAIKRILPTMGEDRDFIKMFIDEAKIAGQLAHANICQIFELGRIDGAHFIAMEYIWGKDLLQIQNRLRKLKQPMPIAMACFCIAKVLEGLDYAHRKRDPLGRALEIVHRDCSPQNVLVSYEGEVKVIDFGIAKATSRNSRTMAGVLKGKFGYMSPEQVRGLPLDRRSDIFAIGTMLYECLTGERLFQGETDFSTLEKVRNVDIQTPRSVNPAIPEAVEKVILKALAKDVEDRYQWCSEMLADLQQFLMSQDVVFTAKSLSSWLKDVYTQDLERERALLEQYKRVGRDGLIAGVPAAEAKLDVVEHLGEAGPTDGDPTMLGGPNFDELEHAMAANAEVGPAPGSPAVRTRKPTRQDSSDGDFGEEAPTEIFGEIDHGTLPQPASTRAPTGAPSPATKPPRPPPTRPPSQRDQMPLAASSTAPGRAPTMLTPSRAVSTHGVQPMAADPGLAAAPEPMPAGYPPHGNSSSGPIAANGAPQKTVLGVQAPTGLGNYGGGYRGAQPQPLQQSYPGYPQGYPGYPQAGYPGSGPMQMPPAYPGGPQRPVDQTMPVTARPKSSLSRDIGIGVAIAAVVLISFLTIKLLVLDRSSSSPPPPRSAIATLKLQLPKGVAVELYVDDKKVGSFGNDAGIPVTAGLRHVKLIGPGGARCEQPVKLDPGQTKTLDCVMSVPGAGGGSAALVGSGSAEGATTVAETKPAETKPAEPKPVATKPADTNLVQTKPAIATPADANPPEGKPADTKPVDTKPADTTATTKPADVKPADTKTKPPVEIKPVDTKPADPKTVAKPTDVKPADAKIATDPKAKPVDSKKPADSKAAVDDAKEGPKGYVQVFSKPSAKILVDGIETGMSTPISGHTLPLAPGKHKITFLIGEDRFTYPIVIKAGATETMSKDLQ